jgi:sigma-B regulation protein RsbU (phosphoserine phosphatase)
MDVARRNNVTVSGGADAQPIVFAHGFGCDQNMWRLVAPAFEDDFRVVLFDHVGAGRSDLASYDVEKYESLDGYAADVVEICESLGSNDIIFIGHSVSAMIGVLAVNQRPDLFDRLVMVGPSPRYIDDGSYKGGFTEDDVDGLLAALDSNYLGWSQAMAPVIMANAERPELGNELTNSFCRTDPDIAKRFAKATFLSDNPGVPARCRVTSPVVVEADYYDEVPAGLVTTDLSGVIVRANATFARWIGRDAIELVGMHWQDLLARGSGIFYETHMAPLMQIQGIVEEIAMDFAPGDGPVKQALVNGKVSKATNDDSRLMHFSVMGATFRRDYEREILAAKEQAEASEERARSLAKTLQDSLIPPTPPRIPGVDVGTAYRPAGRGDEVGGDFYDIFQIADQQWVVVLGDVCGKGVHAATVTALARYTLRAAAITDPRPSEMLRLLNDAIQLQAVDTFCTAVCIHLDLSADRIRMTLSLGGHPHPLLVNERGAVNEVGLRGDVLGLLDAPELHDVHVDLAQGESIVLYTDGVTEARSGDEFFGDENLCRMLTAHCAEPAAVLADIVAREVVDLQGQRPRDDLAIVVLRQA